MGQNFKWLVFFDVLNCGLQQENSVWYKKLSLKRALGYQIKLYLQINCFSVIITGLSQCELSYV